jgi:agmatine deiminase
MPAEWARHSATWIAWPHNEDDWPGRFEPIPWVYGEIVRKLSQVERVCVLVNDAATQERAGRILRLCGANMPAVAFHVQTTDRVWIRDFGPIFVYDNQNRLAAVKCQFNGWAKYENHHRDEAAGRAIGALAHVPAETPDFVLEGGSIDVNGSGLLLSTEECLLSDVQARNPGLTRADLECRFRRYLGVDRVIWLRNGISGDDTHGHIDDLARFTDSESVIVVEERDPSDDNHEPLRENIEILRREPLRVRTLPMPQPLVFNDVRLPASYANLYIANDLVLVPTFNDPNDRIALNTLAECFPRRRVVGIDSVELVWGLGTLHCMTQQQPAELL